MIKVTFKYKRKSDGLWCQEVKEFYSCEKARRFMYKIDAPKSPSYVVKYE